MNDDKDLRPDMTFSEFSLSPLLQEAGFRPVYMTVAGDRKLFWGWVRGSMEVGVGTDGSLTIVEFNEGETRKYTPEEQASFLKEIGYVSQ